MRYYLLLLITLFACKTSQDHFQIEREATLAWCIVPFDSEERKPQARIEMLKELGFESYAYDWRAKHLDEMAGEIRLARENDIDMAAVWLWIDANSDSIGQLSTLNERMLAILEESGLQTTIWMSFNGNYFEGLTDEESLEKAIKMVEYLNQRSNSINCKLALYNHGDWFGEPDNQISIIKALPQYEMGIIYNFHHAHHQLDAFPQMVKKMAPYLWAVNLNGMNKDGPKIMTIGEGEHEKEMIQMFWDAGFRGPWGILGHIETEDVKEVLKRNLVGLQKIHE